MLSAVYSAARRTLIEQALAKTDISSRAAAKYAEKISWLKAHALGPEACEPEVAPVYTAYRHLLEHAGAIDFDDLVLRELVVAAGRK